MEFVNKVLVITDTLLPFLTTVAFVLIILISVNAALKKRWQDKTNMRFHFQLIMLALTFISGLSLIVALPISDTLKGQLLGLIGILLSAAIALSSTTFIGNILAGIMLRVVNSTRPGDFVTVEDINGRVTEMGLLHIEVQTEDRDLVTIPNLLAATKPLRVARASGTIVSAEISLGYDMSRTTVSKLLVEAAIKAHLTDAFVQVRELGDFSILYRVAGLLTDVTGLISARSKLREAMLDTLHDAGVEIISPNFINTKVLEQSKKFIPTPLREEIFQENVLPEDLVFDKADTAASVENLRKLIDTLNTELTDHKTEKVLLTHARIAQIELEKSKLLKSLEDAEIKQKISENED